MMLPLAAACAANFPTDTRIIHRALVLHAPPRAPPCRLGILDDGRREGRPALPPGLAETKEAAKQARGSVAEGPPAAGGLPGDA